MYDYGARMMMPDLGRWGAMDAMSEKYSSWSPYNYAINNPVMVIDPDGNDIQSPAVEAAQSAFRAYVATMSTSTETSGGNIFTGFNSPDWHEDKNGKLLKDKGDNVSTLLEYINSKYKDAKLSESAAKKLFSTLKNGMIDLDQLNPETLNQNLFGYNYPGAKNPRKYNGKADYSIPPTEIEVPAYIHDKEYDKLGAVGAGGLFRNTMTINADDQFVESMRNLENKYREEGNYKLMFQARTLGRGLNAASQPKRQTIESVFKQAITFPKLR